MDSTFSLSLRTVQDVTWVIGGITIALSVGRYYIRWRTCGFLADDVAHLAAIIFMLAKFSLFSATLPLAESYEYWVEGDPVPPFASYQAVGVVSNILLFLSIWAVKFAFTLLYRTLCNLSTPLKILWLSVLLFNIVTLGICIGSTLSVCGGNVSRILDIETCGTEQNMYLVYVLSILNFTCVISSDLATALLPAAALLRFKMRPAHRLAVLFAMAVSQVTIAFEVLRSVRVGIGSGSLNFWGNWEIGVAIIVSTFPAYYSLIAKAYGRRFPTTEEKSVASDRSLKCTCASSPCSSPV